MVFCIVAAKHFVHPSMKFLSSALLGGRVVVAHDFEFIAAFMASGDFLPFLFVAHACVSDVRLIAVLLDSPLTTRQQHLASHQRPKVDWDDDACVGCFPSTYSSGEVLDIPVRDVTSAKRNVDVLQVENLVGSVPV